MEVATVETPAKKSKKRRKFSKPLILLTILLQLALSGVISLEIIAHGPFENVRNYLIGTAMASYKHQYLAELLFSSAQIDKVMQRQNVSAASQTISAVKPKNLDSDQLEVDEINSPTNAFHGYVIVVSNPLRVHAAYTNKFGKVGEFVSSIAERKNAIAAINGGGFQSNSSWTGTGAYPSDFIISNGSLVWKADSLKASKDTCNVIALNRQGTLVVGPYTLNKLMGLGNIVDAVTMPSYQPLIVNGKATYKDESGFGTTARTVIAQKKDGTILLMVLDGRQFGMPGATVKDAEDILIKQYDAWTAGNLDGGASTAMYYDGEIINKPCGSFGERTVATAFYVDK